MDTNKNNKNLDIHKYFLDLGFKVSEIFESQGLKTLTEMDSKVSILEDRKKHDFIQGYSIYPTKYVPESIENTEYFSRTNLEGLFSVYVLENK